MDEEKNEEKNTSKLIELKNRILNITPTKVHSKSENLLFTKKELEQCEPNELRGGRKFRSRHEVTAWTLHEILRECSTEKDTHYPKEMMFRGLRFCREILSPFTRPLFPLIYSVQTSDSEKMFMTTADILFQVSNGSWGVLTVREFLMSYEPVEKVALNTTHLLSSLRCESSTVVERKGMEEILQYQEENGI